jgi:biopolymer transport protein ExbD
MINPTNVPWRVRSEDGLGEGRLVEFPRLTQAISDGILGEGDQVRGPGDAQWFLIGEHPQTAEHLPPQPLFKPRDSDEAEMDMTPMIDVTFQLLIFFMITACFVVQKTLDMPPVQSSDQNAPKRYSMSELQKNNVVVAVKVDGSVTVDTKPVNMADLPDALKEAAKGRDNVEIVLDVEDDVEHETVVQVLDAAGAAQIEKIHFIHRVSGSPPAKTG